jgi:predicted permease
VRILNRRGLAKSRFKGDSMADFVHILTQNIAPLAFLIGVGILLERRFRLDVKTMSKLLFYLFSPVLVFVKLYQSTAPASVFVRVLLFFVIFFVALNVVVEIVSRIRRYQGGMRSAMRNSVIFYNSANYGISVNHLVFAGNPFAQSIQIVIMMMQNLIPNTYGVYSVNRHKQTRRQIFRTIRGLPALYAIPLALILRFTHTPIPQPIYLPMSYITEGFLAFALTTLGMQLGQMQWRIKASDVALSNLLRLVAGPLLAYGTVRLLDIHGITAEALVLSGAVPTSLSSMILAVEFDNEPDFASQAVFSSTLFSIVTVTAVILLLPSIH